MARLKRTPVQAEYYKQRKRLQSALSRERSSGYVFTENVLPQIPSRITKASVEKLKKIKPKDLRSKASGVIDFETGEYIKKTKTSKNAVEQLAKQQRPKRKNKEIQYETPVSQAETEESYIPTFDIIQYITDMLNSLPLSITRVDRLSSRTKRVEINLERSNAILIEALNQQIAEYGDEIVSAHLLNNENVIQEIISEIETTRYQDEVVRVYHNLMSAIIIDNLSADVQQIVDDYANMWGEDWSAFG